MTSEQETMVVAPPTPLSPSVTSAQSLNDVTALARFEFEPGKGNEGTKIMMVEWQDDDGTRDKTGSWNVSWASKSTVFPADDNPADNIRRLYFLLPPGQTIPPHIAIAYVPPATETKVEAERPESLLMHITPLPAIFTPELGATAKASGKKGVLHTIWAKRRLQVLDKEIRSEQEHNLEGVALQMAVAEKEWIEQNFGLTTSTKKPVMSLDMSDLKSYTSPPQSPGLQSPKSPGGRRLSEKLKGLSIGTSERELMGNRGVNTPTRELHPLSPELGDMAVSSFSAFRDKPLSAQNTTAKRIVSHAPPDSIRQAQSQSPAQSLAFMSQASPASFKTKSPTSQAINDDPDDLFAVALSPRSPDDPKSPFSIPSSEVGAFAKIKGSQV